MHSMTRGLHSMDMEGRKLRTPRRLARIQPEAQIARAWKRTGSAIQESLNGNLKSLKPMES